MFKALELNGRRFGRLFVVRRFEENKGNRAQWLCKCDCGKEVIVISNCLTSGHTKSCGCLSRETLKKSITKHGGRHTKLYSIWCGMKVRCYNLKHEHYKYYGKKGICLCDDWLNDFKNFQEWSMENGYKNNLEIDRKDQNGNYTPLNCRWVTRKQQVRNRSNTVFLECNGVVKTLKEWADLHSIKYKLAHARYKKGWSFERIFKP